MYRIVIAAVTAVATFIGTVRSEEALPLSPQQGHIMNAAHARSAPIQAAPTWSGFAYTSILNRSLFTNSGFAATTGPASNSVFELKHNPSGLYVNAFGTLPFQDFSTGAEVDIRVGKRAECLGEAVCDLSVAWYRFGISNLGYWETANARFNISKSIKIDRGFTVTPHAYVDYGWTEHAALPGGHNALGLQLGALTAWNLNALPGKPTLAVDWMITHYPVHEFAPSKGPIYAAAASLGFNLGNSVTVGPLGALTVGAVDSRDPHKVRGFFGAFIQKSFSID